MTLAELLGDVADEAFVVLVDRKVVETVAHARR